MKGFLARLKRFFFPEPGAPRWVRVLPYAVLGVLTLLVLTAGAFAWDYTNSPGFCGTSCHTMPPEYSAYLASPHARVDCVDCHIGKSFIATKITRKAGDMRHVLATAFHSYEYPINARQMRPARETCELCHNPEKFSDDSLKEIKYYDNDPNNTPHTIYLTLKTGGGSQRQGLGRGIHWHIENPVYFLPTDELQQNIPYIKVQNADGTTMEYVDIESGLNPASVDPSKLVEMDCMTCHNRITHLVIPPEETVDQLISRNLISADIPDIRRESVELISRKYESTAAATEGIRSLVSYYQTYYPEYYTANQSKVDSAVTALEDSYKQRVFPEQESDWDTHPNNLGHKDFPGCFRCHDGKHLNAQNQAIRLECNLCHSIPVVTGPNDFVAKVEISRGPEPQSHLNQNWINLHRDSVNDTCSQCHSTENPGGTDNTSFCSNSACHGSTWKFAGFDAPQLRAVLMPQIPPTPTPMPASQEGNITYDDAVGPLFQTRCGSCHGDGGIQGLNLTTYAGVMAGSDNGPVIVPGEPDQSLLIKKQTADTPHFSQLSPQELDLVSCWIKAGAPEN